LKKLGPGCANRRRCASFGKAKKARKDSTAINIGKVTILRKAGERGVPESAAGKRISGLISDVKRRRSKSWHERNGKLGGMG